MRFMTIFTALRHGASDATDERAHLGGPRPPRPCARRCEQQRCREHVPPALADRPASPWLWLARLRALQCGSKAIEGKGYVDRPARGRRDAYIVCRHWLSCTAAPDILQDCLRYVRALTACGGAAGRSPGVLGCPCVAAGHRRARRRMCTVFLARRGWPCIVVLLSTATHAELLKLDRQHPDPGLGPSGSHNL